MVLRTADSVGAPATLTRCRCRRAEVTVLEARDGWVRVRLAGGGTGWVPQTAATRVLPST
ncbi:MAG: hypothetical protein R2939_10165 [Kofleriaceae bacterium]